MKKLILTAVALFVFTATFADETYSVEGRKKGCREWYVTLFGWTILAHHSSECGNSDGNWDWGGNGTNP